MPEEEVPGGFFRRALEQGSDINKEIVNARKSRRPRTQEGEELRAGLGSLDK